MGINIFLHNTYNTSLTMNLHTQVQRNTVRTDAVYTALVGDEFRPGIREDLLEIRRELQSLRESVDANSQNIQKARWFISFFVGTLSALVTALQLYLSFR